MIQAVVQMSEVDECLVRAYLLAKDHVIRAGFANEIDWQEEIRPENITESDFLGEGAWVIVCAGLSEKVARKLFPGLSNAFLNWRSACEIVAQKRVCRQKSLSVLAHEGKVEAVIYLAEVIARDGFQSVFRRVKEEGVSYLQTFPYLGPATSYHLAKNLGFNVAKPDRHLKRVSRAAGFRSPSELCATIAKATGERAAVVDLVIWRFATLYRDYASLFSK